MARRARVRAGTARSQTRQLILDLEHPDLPNHRILPADPRRSRSDPVALAEVVGVSTFATAVRALAAVSVKQFTPRSRTPVLATVGQTVHQSKIEGLVLPGFRRWEDPVGLKDLGGGRLDELGPRSASLRRPGETSCCRPFRPAAGRRPRCYASNFKQTNMQQVPRVGLFERAGHCYLLLIRQVP